MTKRKPLDWYDTGHRIGVDGKIPDCDQCHTLLFSPGFVEAVHSVSIGHPGSPGDLARRVIEAYHARRHPAAEWGLDGDR
jgi:hypothetical protein